MSFIAAAQAGLTPRMITVSLAALIVALLALMGVSGGLIGGPTLSKLWSAPDLRRCHLRSVRIWAIATGSVRDDLADVAQKALEPDRVSVWVSDFE